MDETCVVFSLVDLFGCVSVVKLVDLQQTVAHQPEVP